MYGKKSFIRQSRVFGQHQGFPLKGEEVLFNSFVWQM